MLAIPEEGGDDDGDMALPSDGVGPDTCGFDGIGVFGHADGVRHGTGSLVEMD